MATAVAHPNGDAAPSGDSEALPRADRGWRALLRTHWPEYFMEGAELAAFMVSACAVVTLLFHPRSPFTVLIPDMTVRRVLTGIAMGLTAVTIVYSPWGKQSGAHFNPSVTVTFWRLGRIATGDALFYVLAQFVGALTGVRAAAALLGDLVTHPAVNYVATQPGAHGVLAAFAAELLMSFGMMTMVLVATNTPRLAAYTGWCCGAVVAAYISIASPVSGMSMNPARSFGPALVAGMWRGLWIYFTAPPLGMLAAAEVYTRLRGPVACAKLHHRNRARCIFCHTEEAL